MCVCRHIFSTSLNKCQGTKLSEHMVRICLVLQETAEMSSKGAMPALYPYQQGMSFGCSTSSPVFGIGSILDFSHFNTCIVISHSFNLQFSDEMWHTFHMLICHLYILFFFQLFIFNQRVIALILCWFLPYINMNQP